MVKSSLKHGLPLVSMPINYLGLPLGAKQQRLALWKPVVERIEGRLAAWKRQTLSNGGRLTLVCSCLASMPIYFLSIFPIPAGVWRNLERLMRDFLWGDEVDRRTIHMISWENICKPLEFGGLGIRGFKCTNKTLLTKWIWRFTQEPNALWRRIIAARYGTEPGGIFPKQPLVKHGASLWKKIMQEVGPVHDLYRFKLGDGKCIRFWFDRWCSDEPLMFATPDLFAIVKRKKSLVAEVVKWEGNDMTINMKFSRQLNDTEMRSVVNIHNWVREQTINMKFSRQLNAREGVDDELIWEVSEQKGFTVKECYEKLVDLGDESFPVKKVWKAKVPLRICLFAWTAFLGKLKTADQLRRRNVEVDERCKLCGEEDESSDHLLIHCAFANEVWIKIVQTFGKQWVAPETVEEVFRLWRKSQGEGNRHRKVLWSILPHAVMWSLWLERNERTFNSKQNSADLVVLKIKTICLSWVAATQDLRGISYTTGVLQWENLVNA